MIISTKNLHKRRYEEYVSLKEGIIKPYLEEFWYLRMPAFAAVLSIFFFAFIPQTLEVYRIFSLNLIWRGWHIILSFVFLFLLSLSIWYSGRVLSLKRKNELTENYPEWRETLSELSTKQHDISLIKLIIFLKGFINRTFKALVTTLKGIRATFYLKSQEIENIRNQQEIYGSVASTKVEALLWLPRLLGMLPLLALIGGLVLTLRVDVLSNQSTIGGIIVAVICVFMFLGLVIWRKSLWLKSRTNRDILFSRSFQAFTFSLSILSFSTFTIPLITDEKVKFIACLAIVSILFLNFKTSKSLRNNFILFYLFLSTVFILLLLLLHSSAIPSLLGPISIVAIYLSVFVIFTSVMFSWGHNTKLPILTSLLILAIVFSWFNLNNNHRIREAKLLPDNNQPLLGLEESFTTWLNSRPDRSSNFRDGKYPIYIVSAQGGGIFAAYHAALTLSRLQDLSPNFASHVFAISGVSGGSLGATVFSSLVKTDQVACHDGILPAIRQNFLNPESLEAKAHCLLGQDFLSPLLAAGLFPDFVQRFLPSIPFLSEALDRARGLEYAFEHAWVAKDWEKINPLASRYKQQNISNPLTKSYYEHWNSTGKAPALVFNTTVVETGERLLVSPFTFNTSDLRFPVLRDISTVACPADKEKDYKEKGHYPINFRLSTAAILSARFPLVTPVAWFSRCNHEDNSLKKIYHLADGGYFENSGFSTAFEIGERLKKISIDPKYKQKVSTPFKIVYLAITDNYFTEVNLRGLNEIASPFFAFTNSREARGRSVVEKAKYEIDDTKSNNLLEHEFRQFYLTHVDPSIPLNACRPDSRSKICKREENLKLNLPLGWYLSAFSQEYIRHRIGHPTACSSSKPELANNNHCVMKSIIDELTSAQ